MSRPTPSPSAGGRLRLGLLGAAFLAALGFLALRLHDIQVRDRDLYLGTQAQMTLRRVRLPATRGKIRDRNGVPLADNAPSFCIALYFDELRAPGRGWSNTVDRIEAQIARVAAIVGRPPGVSRREIAAHLRTRRPIPMVAFEGLDDRELARLAEWPEPLAGVDVLVRQNRVYPFGDMACHVIGYVGRDVNPVRPAPPAGAAAPDAAGEFGPDENGAEDFDYALPELVGRDGVEKAFDAVLAGRGGAEVLRIDVSGYKREVHSAGAPRHGSDIALTLDKDLQLRAEEALRPNRGAAIVLDARNGDVLALASAPRFDLSTFVPSLPGPVWRRLLEDPDRPLYHRALLGTYPPGSVVKPVVALTALGAGAVSPFSTVHCDGRFRRGGIDIRCASRWGHGDVDVRHAIAASCNPFFIECGLRLGWAPALHDAFEALGLGAPPRLGIPAAAGLLPDSQWKKAHTRDHAPWTAGDTANASIGQGFLLASPMQIARLALALANDGDIVEPRLVRDPGDGRPRTERVVADHVFWRPQDLELVRRGMVDATLPPHGTARRAAVPGLRFAAKTGTAEFDVYRPLPGTRRHVRERHKNAWIIAYAPADAPRYAFAVLAEDSDSGGHTAAAILRTLLLGLFPPPPGTQIPDTQSPDEEETHAEFAESAELESHAEGAENAELHSHAESAENAEPNSHAEGAENAEDPRAADDDPDTEPVSEPVPAIEIPPPQP